MKTEDIVKEVLEQYVGSQINIDSEAARDLLAKHIASEVDLEIKDNLTRDFWSKLDDGAKYNAQAPDDLHI